MIKKIALILLLSIPALILGLTAIKAQSQVLTSTNYKILDSNIDSGSGAATSTNYGVLTSIGNAFSDARLTSGTYAIGSGFPHGAIANVPKVLCAETNTTSINTLCLSYPNNNGAQGECGSPGCYDRAKVEVDFQNNPYDTLYLVAITNITTSTVYYVKSTHFIGTTYTIADYMTKCQLEGKDINNPNCNNSLSTGWNLALQRNNVYGLGASSSYSVQIKALSGNFTETQFGPSLSFLTQAPSLLLNIDIGTTTSANNSAPYIVNLTLNPGSESTATNLIWLSLATNGVNGITTFVADQNVGLKNGTFLIPSQAEDVNLDTDKDGGYGLKINLGSMTQTSLGPLQADNLYNNAGAEIVGNLSTTPQRIFYTNTTGANVGQLTGGRVGTYVKAIAQNSSVSGIYTDILFYTAVINF